MTKFNAEESVRISLEEDKVIATIRMGLNTSPEFTNSNDYIERLKKSGNVELAESMLREKERTREIANLISYFLDEELFDRVQLTWSCFGEERHNLHAEEWERALPQYEFSIDRYYCAVRRRR